jgi:hypothetical protein
MTANSNTPLATEERQNSLVGGGIVIWVGVMLMLWNQGLLGGIDFAGFLMMGIGVILVLGRGLAFKKPDGYEEGLGFTVGGGIMILIGAGLAYNIRGWWAFLIIGLGLLIISRGLFSRTQERERQ